MKEIELTQGYRALIDDEDLQIVSTFKWYASKRQTTVYARTGLKNGKKMYLHHFLMKPPKGFEVDHINRNTLDNRRSNLRLATHAENNQNKSKQSNNKSGFKGVYFFKRDKKWDAQIAVKGVSLHLGRFITPQEAAKAYNEAAKFHFGAFAYLNEI